MILFPCENCIHFIHFTLFREWKQTKKYYSSSARALQRTQNWGWCSVLHFSERALQSDGDATSVLLCKVNAYATFDLDTESYMKTFKSELATEILQTPHDCSVSLKQPQLSASLRAIAKTTWHSHNTFCLCVLLIGFRLPAGVQPVSLATSNACKPQWYLFLSLFVQSQAEWSQPGGFEHQYATGRCSWREQFPAQELATATTSCPSEVRLCPTWLSLLLQ